MTIIILLFLSAFIYDCGWLDLYAEESISSHNSIMVLNLKAKNVIDIFLLMSIFRR